MLNRFRSAAKKDTPKGQVEEKANGEANGEANGKEEEKEEEEKKEGEEKKPEPAEDAGATPAEEETPAEESS